VASIAEQTLEQLLAAELRPLLIELIQRAARQVVAEELARLNGGMVPDGPHTA
jgi:hypothetical protein